MRSVISFLGIGSNLSTPVNNCLRAIESISSIKGINVIQWSSLYRTEPVGFSKQEWFVNGVVKVSTILSPHSLLRALQEIEYSMGRRRTAKWGPRTIDIDILFYGNDIVKDDKLTIPHPEVDKRRFVITPLCEIAPYFIHPVLGASVRELLNRLMDKSEVVMIKKPVS